MAHKSKGNLLLTFIILIALSMSVFAFLEFMAIRLRESSVRASDIEAFYVADAGLNKAIWDMSTSVSSGGKGVSWRTGGTTEAFGWGSYTFSILNYATGEAIIISTGEVSSITRTVSQVMQAGGLPTAFSYAIYTNAALSLSGNANIDGDIYVNGNTTFSGNADVTDGDVYHSSGSTISGRGTYTDGGTPDPVPSFPTMDTSYYDDLIATAQGATSGNKSYSNTTVNLNGSTVYVKGDVTISGNTTFNGPGAIVATGTISLSGNTYSNNSVNFISQGNTSLTGNTYTGGAIYYSATSLSASGNTRVQVGGFLSKGSESLSGNVNMSGIIYSLGTLSLSGNPVIRGTVVSGSTTGVTGLSGNSNITFDNSVFPQTIPPGFTSTSISKVKGTWKGY